MERIIIDMGLVMVALGMGYWMGFRACFDYLMQELKTQTKIKDRKRKP